jgi:hypothetical protein
MAPIEHIGIRIERDGGDRVKIVWSDSTGAQFPPYRLVRQWLRDKSDRSRAALQFLRAAYLHPKPDFAEGVAALANHGRELRMALFNDCPPEDRNAAEEPRRWFDSLCRDTKRSIVITVHADPILPIPWGLLHEGAATSISADPYHGFWALRFSVATLYNGMKPRHLENPRPTHNVRLLSAINQAVFDSTRKHLGDAQRSFISAFLERPVGMAFSTAGCRERWREVGDRDCIIYFYGHASGVALQLAANDTLTASGFRSLFGRESGVIRTRVEPGYVLTVLNGCATVTGPDADSFLLATADPGFCGFVGAEAIVPDRFALLFGQELLYCLLTEGLSVREAMSRLWIKHNPMALFYGCYAHPKFAVARDSTHAPLPMDFDSRNFYPAHEAGV